MPDSTPAVYYGGQAVIEGVMIRAPEHFAVACRHPNGEIVTHAERLGGIYTGRARRIPMVRGSIVLWETMALGMRALSFSSKVQMDEPDEKGETVEFPAGVFWGAIALAMVFMVGIFFAGPILLANLLERWDVDRLWIVAVEGALRLAFFVGYLALISAIPDIRRVFMYHGAEHMTIHAYEAKQPLTIAAVRAFPKEHTRCGTSFLLVVVIVSLITFFAFDAAVDRGLPIRFASRIILIPLVAAVSYEILRIGARFDTSPIVKAAFAPNILLQALTTKVPEDAQIEVAIASFEAALAASETPTAP